MYPFSLFHAVGQTRCHTQDEIAKASECDQKTITNTNLGKMEDLPKFLKTHPTADHLTSSSRLVTSGLSVAEKIP